MTDSGDAAALAAKPVAPVAVDEPASRPPAASDDRATRRAALRDLAAMIGVEVFY